ncbi:hypothetical protein M569_09223, partial [Genlisea aurea]
MKFTVKGWSKGGGGRRGVLEVGGCSLETPALLIGTRKGLPAFISPDLLSSLPTPDACFLQFSPLHFSEGMSMKTVSELGGLHKMLGLRGSVFMAVPRDSISSLPSHQSTNKTAASFESPFGRLTVKPSQYVEMISSLKPNIWASLPDEAPSSVSEKRTRTSVDRTLKWLDDCLQLNLHSNIGGAVFGSIVGGSKSEERRRCAVEVSKRDVSGFCIAGFGLGESVDERSAILDAVTESLPEGKPRHISGLGLPVEILQGVAAGIDLFDSTYIYHLTVGGFALTFPLDGNKISDAGDGGKIDLKASTLYRKDASPILAGCSCYACRNHTKAYLNHLLNVHELLAHILLEIHNTHHYLLFFRNIRASIESGSFGEFRRKYSRDQQQKKN